MARPGSAASRLRLAGQRPTIRSRRRRAKPPVRVKRPDIERERWALGAPNQIRRREFANPRRPLRSAPPRTGLRRLEPKSPSGIARRPCGNTKFAARDRAQISPLSAEYDLPRDQNSPATDHNRALTRRNALRTESLLNSANGWWWTQSRETGLRALKFPGSRENLGFWAFFESNWLQNLSILRALSTHCPRIGTGNTSPRTGKLYARNREFPRETPDKSFKHDRITLPPIFCRLFQSYVAYEASRM
jgi:hypothetical protein